ncbi:MAG TPA: hypothetical protein VFP72_09700 [Kineosporiaceae bacterium]|nr:hypothetical protein [Kineosporiaceae bacterium]
MADPPGRVAAGPPRIYRGLIPLIDVVAGAPAGGLWTATVLLTLLPARTEAGGP